MSASDGQPVTGQNQDAAESIAVYDDRQRRILRGEMVGIVGGAMVVLALAVLGWWWTSTDLFSIKPRPVRAEFAYNYAGVQLTDYTTYLGSVKRPVKAPSAEAVTAYNTYVQNNPKTKNVKVLSKYLGDTYNDTAVVFGYMSAYVVPGVGESCEYCHNLQDFSDDSKPTKVIARNMMVMQFEMQNKWVGTLPKPAGQPAHVLVCGTCHYGQAKGWNNDLKLKKPGDFGVEGGGYPYDYNMVDKTLLDARADAGGNVNYFQVQIKETTRTDKVGLAAAERNQLAMYHVNSALAVGCDFCHYGGYFPSYVSEEGKFKWPKAQARHMMGMLQDLSVNYWPQLGTTNTALPNCFMCHRGNTVPPGASPNAPKPGPNPDPLLKPIVDLPVPKSVVPADAK